MIAISKKDHGRSPPPPRHSISAKQKSSQAETKLDSTFLESHFILPGGRKPFRLDVTGRRGELLVFLNNDIPSKYIQSFHLPGDIQAIPYEINLKQRKLLFVSIYRPPDKKLDYFLPSITGLLDQMKVIQQWKLF